MVLDCTDHPTSRYLISDACVLLSKPLISASAFKTYGQLIVLNAPAFPRGDPEGGPCYRCIFPVPPPPSSVLSCGEGGILGPVVGTMGVLQALEAIRLISSGVLQYSGKSSNMLTTATRERHLNEEAKKALQPMLLIFSATRSGPSFRSVRMRGRKPDCFACSSHSPSSAATSQLTLESLRRGGVDYVRFCGVRSSNDDESLKPSDRVSAAEYASRHPSSPSPAAAPTIPEHVLLDVREKEHFDIASIPGAINVPMSTILRTSSGKKPVRIDNNQTGDKTGSNGKTASAAAAAAAADGLYETGGAPQQSQHERKHQYQQPDWLPENLPLHAPIYVVCRQGNDSQVVARRLKDIGLDCGGKRFVGDIKGGMKAWKEEVDLMLPFT